MSRRLSVSVPTRICSSSASNIIRDNGNLVLASGGFMTRISRRGRPAADKDFPIITPTTSDWNIRVVVVGFSAITGFQLGEFVRLAGKIKRRWPSKPIIIGGAHATLTDPHTNLADPLIDFVVFGEGELRLPALLRAIYVPELL